MRHQLLSLMLVLVALHAADSAVITNAVTPQGYPALASPTFISLPLTSAYPGVEFNMRPAVTGGTWPYRFSLRTAPKGMLIEEHSGTITWQSPQAEQQVQVIVVAVDKAGKQAEQAFTVSVGKADFVFVSPDGDDTNPGTWEKPWRTVMRAAEPVANPAQATLYLRGGTYPVNVPAKPGEKSANVLGIMRTSPRRWLAWPGEKPVIDLGWSAQLWKAALDAETAAVAAKKTDVVTTQGYGHRIALDHDIDGMLFDGLEVKNAAYYMFVMWDGNRRHLTWRRCNLHHLYGDYYENSSFIFTFAAERVWDGATKENPFPFGKRPKMEPYQHLIVQDCTITDRPYWNSREGAWHGGGLVWYTTQGCLVEDNRFARIERGWDILDKDNGWDNTYRNNVLEGGFMLAAQGCNDGIDVHHNFFAGGMHIGSQPGWVRNVWIHHNAIRGNVALMSGATSGPGTLDTGGKKLAGPADPDSQALIRAFPVDQRLIHAYANVVDVTEQKLGGEEPFLNRVNADAGFAAGHRFVSWNGNLVDETARIVIGWSRTYINWSELKPCGFDVQGASGAVVLDGEGRLPIDSPWRATYGRDATNAP